MKSNSNRSEGWTFLSSGKFITLDRTVFQETRLHPFPLLICCERVSHWSPFNTNHRADLLLCCSLWVREKSKRSYLLAELAWLKRNMKDSVWFLRSFFLHCQNLKSAQGSFWKDPWVWAREQSVPTDLSSQMRRRTHSLGSQFLLLKLQGVKTNPPPFFPNSASDLRPLWAMEEVTIWGLLHRVLLLHHFLGGRGTVNFTWHVQLLEIFC